MPGRIDIDKEEFKNGWPLISIVVDEEDLYDPERGIIPNYDKRGREWERRAYISYYEDGKLLFETGAGFRLHGDKSRLSARSFRLYFRNEYGADQFKPGVLFGPETGPIKTLVVHYEWPRQMPFTTSMTFDIARRIGCIVPETRPAMLFINGKSRGIYFLSEHVRKEHWGYRIGHDDFTFYNYRKPPDAETQELHRRVCRWTRDKSSRMTMEEAGKHVDVDNLSRYIFSLVFCGTTDGFQGVGVLDKTKADAKWFWINWDVDHSFWDFYRHGRKRELWQQEAWVLATEQHDDWRLAGQKEHDVRSILFRRLVNQCPEYPEYMVRLVMDLLNHRINPGFLNSRLDYYERLALSYGKRNLGPEEMRRFVGQQPDFVMKQARQHYGKDKTEPRDGEPYGIDFEMDDYPERELYFGEAMRLFMENRPHFVRKDMRRYFDVGDSLLCKVNGPPGIRYRVDGFPETAGYQGWYFEGKTITIEIVNSEKWAFSHWIVNGERVEGRRLIHPVTSETVIEPVFR